MYTYAKIMLTKPDIGNSIAYKPIVVKMDGGGWYDRATAKCSSTAKVPLMVIGLQQLVLRADRERMMKAVALPLPDPFVPVKVILVDVERHSLTVARAVADDPRWVHKPDFVRWGCFDKCQSDPLAHKSGPVYVCWIAWLVDGNELALGSTGSVVLHPITCEVNVDFERDLGVGLGLSCYRHGQQNEAE